MAPPQPSSEDERVLKKYVDELNAQSEQIERQTSTILGCISNNGSSSSSSSSSTLAKYLSAAPKFKRSGVMMGSIMTPDTAVNDRDENSIKKEDGDDRGGIYKPKLLGGLMNSSSSSEMNIGSFNNEEPSKKRKINVMDDFLEEMIKTPIKKTLRSGYLKIENVRVSSEVIKEEFSKFGMVNQCFESIKNSVFLEMKRYDAECAMHAMQKRRLGKEQISIRWCTSEEIENNCRFVK